MKDAIKIFEQSLEGKEWYTGPKSAVDCEDVRLCPIAFQAPCIQKLDASINTLKKCKHLRLSTNSIDKMIPLDLDNLEILSMGRNQIKRIEGLDNVKDTLKQLWLSYNGIAVLAGVERNLEVLEQGRVVVGGLKAPASCATCSSPKTRSTSSTAPTRRGGGSR